MATKTFTGTGTFDTAARWTSGTLPVAGDILIIDGVCTMDANESNVYSTLTINAGDTLNMATYNLTVAAVTVNGILTIGTSAGTGLTCVGMTINTGATCTYATGSKINNSDGYSCYNETIFTTNSTGTYVQTGNGNFSNISINNSFYSFTINEGVTLTIITAGSTLTRTGAGTLTINGTLATSNVSCRIGAGTGGSIIIGENGDITGTNNLTFYCNDGPTFTNNRTTAFTFSGTVYSESNSAVDGMLIPAWDFGNANVIINGSSVAGRTRTIGAGTLSCINFTILPRTTNDMIFNLSTNNTSFSISGNILLNDTSAAITYTKGTGTITGIGTTGTQTWDFAEKTIEDLVLNCSGAIKQLTHSGTVTTDSLTITAGTLDFNGQTLISSGATSITGTFYDAVGITFTSAGITINSGATMNILTTTVLSCGGNYSCNNSTIFSNNYRGKITLTASGSWANQNANNIYYEFTQNVSVSTTVGTAAYISSVGSNATTINGTLVCGGNTGFIGSSASGSVTFGASSDITSTTGGVYFSLLSGGTYTNSKATAFSATNFQFFVATAANYIIPVWDYSNATLTLGITTVTGSLIPDSGTIKCAAIAINVSVGLRNLTILNSTNNPSWEISGNFSLSNIGGTFAWTRGTGVITFTGSTGTITPNSKTLEALVFNCTSAKSFAGDCSTLQITGTQGTVNSTVAGTQRTITVTNITAVTGMTFKDISVGAKDKINAKLGSCVSLGNNNGIIFKDRLRRN